MRCFVAAVPPPDVAAGLDRLVARLRPALPRVRWVHPAARHLTLLFLGEIAEADAARLGEALAGLADSRAQRTGIRGLGAFPSAEAARVIWAGLTDPGGGLSTLARRVRAVADEVGVGPADKKPFVAHLTLGRMARPCALGHIDAWGAARDTDVGSWVLDRITVMSSRLLPTGPEYTEISVTALAPPAR